MPIAEPARPTRRRPEWSTESPRLVSAVEVPPRDSQRSRVYRAETPVCAGGGSRRSTSARRSSTRSSGRSGGRRGSPSTGSATSRGSGPARARARPSTARTRDARRSRSPAGTARRGVVLHELAHWALSDRARPPGARPHVHAAPARRDARVRRRGTRRAARSRVTPSTRCTSAGPRGSAPTAGGTTTGTSGSGSAATRRSPSAGAPTRPRPASSPHAPHATATLRTADGDARPHPRTRDLVRHPRLTPTPVLASRTRDAVSDAKTGAGSVRGARRSWPCPGRRRRTSSRGRSSCRRPRAR